MTQSGTEDGMRNVTKTTRRAFLAAIGGGLLGVSAANSSAVSAEQITKTATQEGDSTTFTVRLENVSSSNTLQPADGDTQSVPISPGVYVVFSDPNTMEVQPPFFERESPVRDNGLEKLAENGDPSSLAESVENLSHVSESGVFDTLAGGNDSKLADAGNAYEFTLDARPGQMFTFVSMFVPSNDLFFSPPGSGIPLFYDLDNEPKPVSADVTDNVFLWDAGTEKNEEPGTGSNQLPRQSTDDGGQAEGRNTPVRYVSDVDDGYVYPDVDEVVQAMIWPESQQTSK